MSCCSVAVLCGFAVGNVEPGQALDVTVTYVTSVSVNGNALRFSLPVGIGPRYVATPFGNVDADVDVVEMALDAEGLLGAGSVAASSYPMLVTVDVVTGSELISLVSPSHAAGSVVEMLSLAHGVVRAELAGGLAQDFVVVYSPQQVNEPRVWIEHGVNVTGGAEADSVGVMLSLYPDLQALQSSLPSASESAEYVLVVDRSGSMSGQKMADTVAALQVILRGLPVGCTFQIVSFGNRHEMLFPDGPAVYGDDSLTAAASYVSEMSANFGGTELLRTLTAVFASPVNASNVQRVLLLFTDGEVHNTRAVEELCRVEYGRTGTRVFTFGIGADVSHALVKGVAAAAHGEAEFIQPGEDMAMKVTRQLTRVMQLVLENVTVEWPEELKALLAFPVAPAVVPPLYAGSRLSLYAVLKRTNGTIGLPSRATVQVVAAGSAGEVSWPIDVDFAYGGGRPLRGAALGSVVYTSGGAVHAAAAKARIRDLETGSVVASHPSSVTARDEAVALGTSYGVVGKWTSMLAVEVREGEGERVLSSLSTPHGEGASSGGGVFIQSGSSRDGSGGTVRSIADIMLGSGSSVGGSSGDIEIHTACSAAAGSSGSTSVHADTSDALSPHNLLSSGSAVSGESGVLHVCSGDVPVSGGFRGGSISIVVGAGNSGAGGNVIIRSGSTKQGERFDTGGAIFISSAGSSGEVTVSAGGATDGAKLALPRGNLNTAASVDGSHASPVFNAVASGADVTPHCARPEVLADIARLQRAAGFWRLSLRLLQLCTNSLAEDLAVVRAAFTTLSAETLAAVPASSHDDVLGTALALQCVGASPVWSLSADKARRWLLAAVGGDPALVSLLLNAAVTFVGGLRV